MKKTTTIYKGIFLAILFFCNSFCCEAQIITTLSGTGTAGFTGDGGPAGNAQLNVPIGLCLDAAGNLYIGDYGNQRIRKISKATGFITTIAGTGVSGFSGDGGLALNAAINGPYFMCFDNNRNCLYFSDFWNFRIRCIDLSTGIINTIAGDGTFNYISGGIAKTSGMLPGGLTLDASGNIFLSQHNGPLFSLTTNIVCKLDMSTGIITTVAGNGQYIFAGDGGPALNASLANPMGLTIDASGNIYIADSFNQRIRKIDKATGIISTVAGDGKNNLSPDGQLATATSLKNPSDVFMDNTGNPVFADENDLRIRRINLTTGILNSLAGNGYYGYGPDCVPATSKPLADMVNAAMDASGILYFNDQVYHRIRMVIPDNAKPSVQITASATTICSGDPVQFTATVQQGSPADTYQWTVNGNLTTATSSVYQMDSVHNNDIIECQVSSSLGKICPLLSTATSNAIIIYVRPAVTPAVNVSSPNTNICTGGLATFSASASNAGTNVLYQWMQNGNPVGNNLNTFSSSGLSDLDNISCRITADPGQLCLAAPIALSNTMVIHVSATPAPTVQIDAAPPAICPGDSVLFTATPKNAGTTISYQWQWNGNTVNGNQYVFTGWNLSDGDQVNCMIMTTDAACGNNEWVSSNTEIITVKPAPQIHFADSVILIRPGQQAQLQATINNGFISYNWQPASDLIDANTLDPMTIPLTESKIFQLVAMASDGCISEKSLLVKVYFHLAMPNAFTPDGNGKNDLFRIPPKTTMTLRDFSIYDRWGTRVFSTKDIGRGWDGTFNGMPVPAGTFVYIISGQDLNGEILAKGSFLLIR